MEWTADQKKVIDTRKKNILVSAGAGSGKTAVLVQRILSRILDQNDPVNIDELLIVTFTRAAASEMKERIEKSLYEERSARPDDDHLARQTTLIHNAQITTIDGFCAYVVRNYGQTISLTPGMRLMDAGEASLLRADALKDVLESCYAKTGEEGEKFHRFVETYATGKSDRSLEDVVLKLATEAESYPDPFAYLAECRTSNQVADPDSLLSLPWMKEYVDHARETASIMQLYARENVSLLASLTVEANYPAILSHDADYCSDLLQSADYEEFRDRLLRFDEGLKFSSAGSRKICEEEKAVRKTIQENRKALKAERLKLLPMFLLPIRQAADVLNASAGPLDTLIDVTEELLRAYGEKKADKNVCDFSDQEHFALQILRQNGKRTGAAEELSRRFREVMIDEYQDSNFLQEAILTAISRSEDGEQNYFCVGDVKQSIYRFRQARPELFMEKYALYRAHPETGTRIDLHQNFRSRREVIDTVNGIFSQIMVPELGGVTYDEDAALVAGASYPQAEGFATEILPVCQEETCAGESDPASGPVAPRQELEARAIGKRIREMVGHEEIYDSSSQKMRKVMYRDIVILMRSPKAWSSSLEQVLAGMGIPAYVSLRDGYFDAPEVIAVLNILSIIDNPQQDLPLTGVLRSAFVGLSADDLAKIRMVTGAVSFGGSARKEDISMYDAARAYSNHGEDSGLRNKLEDFFSFYDELRASAPDTMLHELIYRILTQTGYLDYVSALPGGAQRVLNLRMLIDRAVAYETGSYIGLFNFIRYIRSLREQNVDLGELSTISENENVVRIMSIHKSKGLEFPVVFVSGLNHQFNKQDLRGKVLIHPAYGVASDYIDLGERVKTPTLRKAAIEDRILHDTLGEELRVLYVAMTRAKQKLILTGTVKNEEAIDNMLLKNLPPSEETIPVGALVNAGSYFAWIIPAADRAIERQKKAGIDRKNRYLTIKPVCPSDLILEDLQTSVRREDEIEKLASLRRDIVYDAPMREAIEQRFSYRYPCESEISLPVEISVSELKEEKYSDREEDFSAESNADQLYPEEPLTPLVPAFIAKQQNPGREEKETEPGAVGARRGTATHRIMQLIDFVSLEGLTGGDLMAAIRGQISSEIKRNRIDEQDAALVSARQICIFFESSLGQRAIQAAKRGDLFRERPFVMGVPAHDLKEEWISDETVFVQGMIDAFFFEDDAAILLDYKTDKIRSAEELADRYRIQVKEYAEAVKRSMQKKVTEKYLWSFRLGRAVRVE